MDRGAHTVYASGRAWLKTDGLIVVRLKGTAPGVGPEVRFYSEDGAAAILKALSKHCFFTRGVLEDLHGVIITEATKHLDPGTYFYIPDSSVVSHDILDLSTAVDAGVSRAVLSHSDELAKVFATAAVEAQVLHQKAGRRAMNVVMPVLYFMLLTLWLVWQRGGWLHSVAEAQNVLTVFRRVVQLADIGFAFYWDPPKYWVALKMLVGWR